MRDGDLELYTMRLDGSDVRRLTGTVGYDGGAFFSPTGRRSSGAPRDRGKGPNSTTIGACSPRV